MRNNHIFEIKRPWWYRTFRGISMFCYRNWLLVWILFIAYLICWYFFCYRDRLAPCGKQQELRKGVESIYNHLDSCCDCSVAKQLSPPPVVPPTPPTPPSPPPPPTPPIPPNAKPCNHDESMSGGKGYREIIHQLGSEPGIVRISYNMQDVKDMMEVYYDDKLVATTGGLVSGVGSLQFYYAAEPGKPTYCKVILRAPQDGTEWSYHIGCPQ